MNKNYSKFTFFLFILLPFATVAYSQDLKKISEHTDYSPYHQEYFVLKEDKSVKHGQYLKYYDRLYVEKYVQEFGYYDLNKKTGIWFFFNPVHPVNPLKIVGEYSNGEKTGQWFYFQTPAIKDTSVLSLLGNSRLTTLTEPLHRGEEYQISIDTTGIKLAATGNFKNGKKVGLWHYFSEKGQLILEYDFSNNYMTTNLERDSTISQLSGGIIEFQELLSQSMREFPLKDKGLLSSEVTFEIITNNHTLLVNRFSTLVNDPFSDYVENTIKNMSVDWIDYNPLFEKTSFILKISYSKEKSGSFLDINSFKEKAKE